MKACFFRKYGGPEVLEYGDWPDPTPAPGEVVVDVHAASVNAADWKMRAGQYGAQIKLPHVPGRDFSGVVSAVGKGANDFKVGDAVFGCARCRAKAPTPRRSRSGRRSWRASRKGSATRRRRRSGSPASRR